MLDVFFSRTVVWMHNKLFYSRLFFDSVMAKESWLSWLYAWLDTNQIDTHIGSGSDPLIMVFSDSWQDSLCQNVFLKLLHGKQGLVAEPVNWNPLEVVERMVLVYKNNWYYQPQRSMEKNQRCIFASNPKVSLIPGTSRGDYYTYLYFPNIIYFSQTVCSQCLEENFPNFL